MAVDAHVAVDVQHVVADAPAADHSSDMLVAWDKLVPFQLSRSFDSIGVIDAVTVESAEIGFDYAAVAVAAPVGSVAAIVVVDYAWD